MDNTFDTNMLKTFDECPQKYNFLYRNKLSLPSLSTKIQSGNRVHLMAHYFLQNMNLSGVKDSLSEEEQLLWENFKKIPLLKNKMLYNEYSFNVKINNFWLTGRIDAIFETNKKIIIADWKTGKKRLFSPDYQSMIYLLAAYLLFKQKNIVSSPEEVEFIYFWLKENTQQKISYSKEKYDNDKNFLIEKINTLSAQKVISDEIKNQSLCYTCNLKTLCYTLNCKDTSVQMVS